MVKYISKVCSLFTNNTELVFTGYKNHQDNGYIQLTNLNSSDANINMPSTKTISTFSSIFAFSSLEWVVKSYCGILAASPHSSFFKCEANKENSRAIGSSKSYSAGSHPSGRPL